MSDFYKSECDQYLCRKLEGTAKFEVWSVDGCLHWRNDNRIVTWADQDKFNHPMAYAVGGYSAETVGQKKGSFTLTLFRCDYTKIIIPFRGNTVIESLDVVFRRKVPPQNLPKWLREQP